MDHTVVSLFKDSKNAGEAIADLNQMGFTKNISVVSKEYDEGVLDTSTHTIKGNDQGDAVADGAVLGSLIGAITAIFAGVSALVLPAAGVLVVGPLAALLISAGAGAAIGGIVGALVEMGVPEERAKVYEEAVNAGETLVSVTIPHDRENEVSQTLENHGAREIYFLHEE